MRDPVAIAKKLIAEVEKDGTLVNVQLGANMLAQGTPAAEVWLDGGDINRQRASQMDSHLEVHRFTIGFFTALTENLAGDEEAIGTVVTSFVNRIEDDTEFDHTLDGLVENVAVGGYDFQIVRRNGYAFRVGIVDVQAGEL